MRQAVREAQVGRSSSKTARVIHRTTFEQRHGMTPQEMHRETAWGGPKCYCYVCGSRAVVIELSYSMPPMDLAVKEPAIAARMYAQYDGQLPVWRSRYGKLVKFAVEYACALHAKQVEIDAAKLPSHILVEIDRGPEPNKRVQVGSSGVSDDLETAGAIALEASEPPDERDDSDKPIAMGGADLP